MTEAETLYFGKSTKMHSECEPTLFEGDVFMEEIPLSDIAAADKAPITADKYSVFSIS